MYSSSQSIAAKLRPVCPACNSKMVALYYVGYYDEFPMWSCECQVIPGSTVEAGSWSYARQGESAEDYVSA